MATVWVYAELDAGRLTPISLELVTKSRELGEVTAIALGPGAREAAGELAEYGAQRVLVQEDPRFAEYLAQPAANLVSELARQAPPDLLLFGFTSDSRDVAGRVAARLGVGLISNAVDVAIEDGSVVARVPYFGATKLALYRTRRRPALVLLRPKVVEPSQSPVSPNIEELDLALAGESRGARILSRQTEASKGVKLEDASVVVSGGRGLGGAENFHLVEDLAAALGGAAGASRAIVDAGWVPYSYQVGQTGKTVRPAVYIAAGISGAMQHTVGMKNAKVIIAINKDADAPIIKMADLGVVGDVLQILPRLTEAVKARKA